MSRTISQLDLGTEIILRENGAEVPYILIRKDALGCVILRAKTIPNKRMNPTNTTVYEGSEADVWLTNAETGFLSRFDENTLSALVTRSIPTFTYGDTEAHYISRKCYLLSRGDMFGGSATALQPETSCVAALIIWKGALSPDEARQAYADDSTSAVNWWLRSPSSAASFYYVSDFGNSLAKGASLACSFRPALNVANDITVGEAEGKIYLLPTLIETYTVEFKGKVVETPLCPTKAVVNYNVFNLSNVVVKVCNNYGDESPTWADATSQTEINLTNRAKETENYEIGIWCYGESTGYGYFEEPRVIFMEV
jgi:hypothetical protein